MGENIFINKKSFDISSLDGKTLGEVEASKNKAFIDIFKALDLNGDNVIDNSEVSVFLSKLKSADFNEDGKLDKDELKMLMKEEPSTFDGDIDNDVNVKFKSIMKFFKTFAASNPQKAEISPDFANIEYDVAPLSDDEAEYSAITSIEDELTRAYDTFYGHQNGVVGGGTVQLRNSSARGFLAALLQKIYI